MCVVPPELIDDILRDLHDDIASLRACSLASRVLLSSSRPYLFKSIQLHSKTPVSFLAAILSKECSFLNLVKSVVFTLCEPLDLWPLQLVKVFSKLRRFPALNSLKLEISSSCWDALEFSPLPKLTTVSLVDINDGMLDMSVDDFKMIEFAFLIAPNAENIEFCGLNWGESAVATFNWPSTLMSLGFHNCQPEAPLADLAASGQPPPIESLVVMCAPITGLQELGSCIGNLAPTLRRMEFLLPLLETAEDLVAGE